VRRFTLGLLLGVMVALPSMPQAHEGSRPHKHAVVTGRFPCEEDEILRGTGDFDGRRWAGGWVCFHPDNL
jgi:hypothetical protein